MKRSKLLFLAAGSPQCELRLCGMLEGGLEKVVLKLGFKGKAYF